MRYIMKLDELYKKTYISASNKLEPNHKERSQKLIDWASEKGLPAKFDRECSHKFEFCKYIGNKYDPKLYGYFFITGIKESTNASSLLVYDVFLHSDYDNDVKISVFLDKGDDHPTELYMKFYILYSSDEQDRWSDNSKIFRFENRKDAMEFKKYLCDFLKDERGIDASKVPINSMFTTNK